ncbi:amino acid transporter AVT6C-like [Impatiens glandulifera]|uniref:amino acid transporter AVT6C-like n=1 Tax=Impatiens glandulifera TaxID=253017 RepID=UPI001FB1719D|nr:amino acid transporter AVT6C-like [Impatiens glandulifera]
MKIEADSDVQAPLLPEILQSATENSNASILGAVFNVSTTIIGAGIMSIPATFKILGVIPAFVSMTIVAFLVDISVEFMLRFTHSGHSTTYAGLMRESFGWPGSIAVQVSVMITNLGCLIIYLIIIGDVLCGNQPDGITHFGVLQEWFGVHWWNARDFVLFLVVVFIMLPLVMVRRVESLKFSSAVSIFLALVFVAICFAMAISAIFAGKTETPRLVPHLDGQASFFNLFTAIPVIVTAFTFHFNVHPIGAEFPKQDQMRCAVRISLVLCASIYIAVGIFGYLLFGDSIMSDLLMNFDQSSDSAFGSLMNDAVRLSYALHLVLVFPLLNFSLRANIDEFLFPNQPPLATDNSRFLPISFILLSISYLLAITIPDIWYFFQFMGSTAAVCQAFIFPSAIVLRDVHGISSRRDKTIATLMTVLALVTSTIAIVTNICNLFGTKS